MDLIDGNGFGILCVALILITLFSLRKTLYGVKIKYKFTTIFIGMLSGIIGLLIGVYSFNIFLHGVLKVTNLIFKSPVLFNAITILLPVLVALGACAVGFLAEKFLRKLCCKKVTIGIAFSTSLFFLARPIFARWLLG